MKKIAVSILMACVMAFGGHDTSANAIVTDVMPSENAIVNFEEAEEAVVTDISYATVTLDEEPAVSNANRPTANISVTTPGGNYEITSVTTDVTGCDVAETVSGETILINASTNNVVVYAGEDALVYSIDECILA